jgi:hypothetical protein
MTASRHTPDRRDPRLTARSDEGHARRRSPLSRRPHRQCIGALTVPRRVSPSRPPLFAIALLAALPTAFALVFTEEDRRERKLMLLLFQTRIRLGCLARMGALALRTKGRSEKRRIEFATDRAGSAPREGSCTSDRQDGEYCVRAAVSMSTTNLTLPRPDLIDHARSAFASTRSFASGRGEAAGVEPVFGS